MATWRDQASEQAQADLDGLLNVVLPFAQKMLSDNGEFFPFGAIVTNEGRSELVAADPGLGERPPSASVLDGLLRSFRAKRDQTRATAACADVHREDTDAVMVALEHLEGVALNVFLPYKKKRFRGGLEFGAINASTGTRQVWPRS